MDRVKEEFYCATSGGGCGGYMVFPLNKALNGVVEVVCPKCKHKHRRMIKNGVLTEEGRSQGTITETIEPPDACWHKKAQHPDSKKRAGGYQEREAVVFEEDPVARGFLNDSIFEKFGK